MQSGFVEELSKFCEEITDTGVNQGNNYNVFEMIFLAVCAFNSDADTWVDVERFGKAKWS